MLKINLKTKINFLKSIVVKSIVVEGDENDNLTELLDKFVEKNGIDELGVSYYKASDLTEEELENYLPINGGEYYIIGIENTIEICGENEFTCLDCGEIHNKDEGYSYKDGYICQDCYEDGYFICEHCGEICNSDDLVCANNETRNEKCVCEYCAENYYTRCNECGCVILTDNSNYNDEDGYNYCDDCYRDVKSVSIHDYDYKPYPIFLGNSNDNLYFGIELEVDEGNDITDCCNDIKEITDDIYMKSDGSLNCGFEIVSHPATIEYHMTEIPWNSIMKRCIYYGFKSHDTTTCGIHVHVSRKYFGETSDSQDLNIAKVILLVNRFWDTHIIKFSRRDCSNLERWAKKSELKFEKDDTSTELVGKMKRENYNSGRYMSINLQNENTIEFRIFRGSLKQNTFFAILQFVETICKFAKEIDLQDIDLTKWNDIFRNSSYKELNDYNKSKELN